MQASRRGSGGDIKPGKKSTGHESEPPPVGMSPTSRPGFPFSDGESRCLLLLLGVPFSPER